MVIHVLSGFLGSGKTTAIAKTASQLMSKGTAVGVITNDQGINLVDSQLFNQLDIPWKQVGNGCFCCNYNDLDQRIFELNHGAAPQIIFAEAVGTCTDIVATVVKPLIKYREAKITLTTFVDARLLHMISVRNKPVFGEEVRYIFFKQMEEAGIVVVNKIDLLNSEELGEVRAVLGKYANKKIIYQNTIAIGGVDQWLEVLAQYVTGPSTLRSLDINYDRYAAGEALLAYYDANITVSSGKAGAGEIAWDLWKRLVQRIQTLGLNVGHLKCWMNGAQKISNTFTQSERTPPQNHGNIKTATLLVNARVETPPPNLHKVISGIISDVREEYDCEITEEDVSVFSPAYPRPVHRIAGKLEIN